MRPRYLCYEKQLEELEAEKEVAYQTCDVLQQEFDLLWQSLNNSKREDDGNDKPHSSSGEEAMEEN